MIALYIVLAVLVLVALAAILIYNGLVGSRNRVDEAWSGIDVQLKRRHDLVPNIVEAVKAYAAHERATLESVTRARTDAVQAEGPAAQGQAEGALTGALGNIRALAERYPELRAAENFQRLQTQLGQIEDEIQASRRIYNANVQSYETRRQVFPNTMVVSAAGATFPPREPFALDSPAEREAPKVAFGA